jgi:ATP-dependent DNA helicase RecG
MDDLTTVLQAGEGYHIEFKQSLDKSFVEEACAFANSGGGRIFLGVADDGKIKGVDTGNVMRSRVQDTLGQIEPKLNCTIQAEGNVLIVQVPEGTEKPYGCSRGFFMRMGANSQKLTRNQIIEFFQKEGRIRWDELHHTKARYPEDFDPEAFSRFLQLAGISSTIDQDALLRNLDCLSDDNQLTNAGVLFFARDIDFLLNHAIVVCALYKGTEKVHVLDKKDFKANLVDNIENAMLFVQRHTKLAYKIKHLRREEIPEYPEVALREALINAVCHRDYFDKRANVMVEVFADRVVITNPGGLPTGLTPEEFGTRSVPRNPTLASLLHRIDYIEKMGTGISRIRQSVEEHGGTDLELYYDAFFTTTFRLKEPTGQVEAHDVAQDTKQVGKKSAKSGDQAEAHDQAHDEAHDLSDTEKRILTACGEGPQSTAELLEALGYSTRTGNFKKAMARLGPELQLLEHTLPDAVRSKNQKYRLTPKGNAILRQTQQPPS